MNYAMFLRNGKSGYVLKPDALRINDKEFIKKRTKHFLDITVSLLSRARALSMRSH